MIRLQIGAAPGKLVYDKAATQRALVQAGKEVAAEATKLVQNAVGGGRLYRGPGGSARKYRGGYKAGSYRASAPGMPPVNVTGTLIGDIKVLPFQSKEGVAVRDPMFYARFLETGAKGPGKRVLLPRPFLTQALDNRGPAILVRLEKAINDGVKFGKAP